jgi:hypothetical protein
MPLTEETLALLTPEERDIRTRADITAGIVAESQWEREAECVLADTEELLVTIAALRAELEIERWAVERLSKFCEASIVSCSYEYCPVYDAGCDRGRDTNCHEVLAAWARTEGGEV